MEEKRLDQSILFDSSRCSSDAVEGSLQRLERCRPQYTQKVAASHVPNTNDMLPDRLQRIEGAFKILQREIRQTIGGMRISWRYGLRRVHNQYNRWASTVNADYGTAESLVAKLKSSCSSGSSSVQHVVAFSGGIDSSCVAAAVYRAFPDSSVAVLGVSPSLAVSQRLLAQEVAECIGIPLVEIKTGEGEKDMYVENEGQACYACKTSLYQGMSWEAVVNWSSSRMPSNRGDGGEVQIKLYNGTNADDVQDTTRVGLKAAREFNVCSPLLESGLSKEEVRAIGKAFGLPNWNTAANPCLRSRLALGVRATPDSLHQVEQAEEIVKEQLSLHGLLHPSTNLRVRHLNSGAAAVELDQHVLDALQSGCTVMRDDGVGAGMDQEDRQEDRLEVSKSGRGGYPGLEGMLASIAELGYRRVDLRLFKSGSVASSSS